MKRKIQEQGISPTEVANKLWTDKRFGYGIMYAGGAFAILLFLIVWTIFLLLNFVFNYPFKFSWLPFALCMVVAFLISYYTVLKEDKYLNYFKQFHKWSRKEKWKYGLLSFSFAAGTISLWIYSFRFLP